MNTRGTKRRRDNEGTAAAAAEGDPRPLRQRRAIAISAKERADYPYATFGRAFIRRGTPENIERFGATYREANEVQKQRRRNFHYVGRGLYSGRGAYSIGKLWRATAGKAVGRALRDEAIGAISGRGLYSGRGSYNVLVDGGAPASRMSGAGDETNTIFYENTEYLQDVFGPANSNFTNLSWSLNPGLIENFPLLAQNAMNYEEYEFVQLLFHFRSTVDASATNNTTGSTGTIVMAVNYNPSSAPFTNKETMMQYHGAVAGRLTDDHTCGVECDPSKNAGTAQKLVRSLPVVYNQDVKSFDLGTFQLAIVNAPSAWYNQQVGELWCTYKVKLTKPKLYAALASNVQEWRAVSNGSESTTALMGTSPLYMQQNAFPVSLVQTSGGANLCTLTFTLPDSFTGLLEFQINMEGTGFTTGSFNSCTVGGNVVKWKDMLGTVITANDSPTDNCYAVMSNQYMLIQRVNVTPVVAGVDNTVVFAFTFNSGVTITQSSIVLRMCPTVYANSPTSTTDNLPLYVNSVGVVTSPY